MIAVEDDHHELDRIATAHSFGNRSYSTYLTTSSTEW